MQSVVLKFILEHQTEVQLVSSLKFALIDDILKKKKLSIFSVVWFLNDRLDWWNVGVAILKLKELPIFF